MKRDLLKVESPDPGRKPNTDRQVLTKTESKTLFLYRTGLAEKHRLGEYFPTRTQAIKQILVQLQQISKYEVTKI